MVKHQSRQEINSVDKHMDFRENFKQFEWLGPAKVPQGKHNFLYETWPLKNFKIF